MPNEHRLSRGEPALRGTTRSVDVVDYQDVYRLAYIRGPEGLIVEVAEPLRSASTGA